MNSPLQSWSVRTVSMARKGRPASEFSPSRPTLKRIVKVTVPSHKKYLDISVGFKSIAPRGHSSKRSAWHSDCAGYFSDEIKVEEREKVLNFILAHNRAMKIRLLSMPGERWMLETELNLIRPNTRFVALESDKRTFVTCQKSMPFSLKSRGVQRSDMSVGTATIPYAATFNKSCVLNMSASAFCSIIPNRYGASLGELRAFNHEFCKNNAVWLDFTSGFSEEVNEAIKNLIFVCNPVFDVPVCITTLYGRDSIQGGQRNRVEHVIALTGNKFHVKESWVYEGLNGAKMLTICGLFRKARSHG